MFKRGFISAQRIAAKKPAGPPPVMTTFHVLSVKYEGMDEVYRNRHEFKGLGHVEKQ
jgi:hypothetical protein